MKNLITRFPVASLASFPWRAFRGGLLLALVTVQIQVLRADEINQHINKGLVAKSQGNWEEAEEAFRAAIAEADKETAGKLPQAAAYHALAGLMHDRGNYGGAVKAYEQAYSRLAEVYGKQSLQCVSCLNNIGQALGDDGRYKEARQKLDQALDTLRTLKLGPHSEEILCLNAIAVLSRREGKNAEAVNQYTEALEVAQKLPTIDAALLIGATINLGVALTEHSDLDKAEKCLNESAELMDKAGVKQNPAFLHAMARLKLKQKDLPKARQHAEQAVELCKQVLGGKHPRTATCMEVLAEISMAQGALTEADALFGDVLSIRETALGTQHPQVAETYAKKARVARAMKKAEESLAASKKSHEILLTTFEKSIPVTYKWVAEEYADLLQAEGRTNDAERVKATINRE